MQNQEFIAALDALAAHEAAQHPGFTKWMREIDRLLHRRYYLSAGDLPDVAYGEWFDDGLTPEEAVDALIEEAGFGEGDTW